MRQKQYYKFMFVLTFCPNQRSWEDFLAIYDRIQKEASADTTFHNWVMQIERGAVQGKPHIQGVIRTKNKCTKSSVIKYFRGIFSSQYTPSDLDTLISALYVEPAFQDFDYCAAYCSKKETRSDERPTYVKDLKSVYVGQDLPGELFPWQSKFMSLIDEQRLKTRSILVLYDPTGGIGKSLLVKKILYDIANAYYVPIFGTAAQLCSALATSKAKSLYLIDLPRSQPLTSELCAVLEGLRGGLVSSAFYGKTNTLLMTPPVVVIFLNTLPAVGKLFSLDRWEIYQAVRPEESTSEDASSVELKKLDAYSLSLKQKTQETLSFKERGIWL